MQNKPSTAGQQKCSQRHTAPAHTNSMMGTRHPYQGQEHLPCSQMVQSSFPAASFSATFNMAVITTHHQHGVQGAASQPGTQTTTVRATLHHQPQHPQGFPHLLSSGTALQAPHADRSLAGRKAPWHLLSVKFKLSDAAWQCLFARGVIWLKTKPSTDIHCQNHSPRDAACTGVLPGGITFHF